MKGLKGRKIKTNFLSIRHCERRSATAAIFAIIPILVLSVSPIRASESVAQVSVGGVGGLVGVKVGDWVKYRLSSTGPMSMSEDVDWIRIDVQNVSDSLVTASQKTHFKNGDAASLTVAADLAIYSVGSIGTLARYYIVSTNHSIGDRIMVEGDEDEVIFKFFVNGTVSRSFLGVSREAYYSTYSHVTPFFEDSLNVTIEYCWDKETGFLLEKRIVSIASYENATPSIWLIEIADTNLWEIKTDSQNTWRPLGLLAFTGAIVGSVTFLAFIKRRPKMSKKLA